MDDENIGAQQPAPGASPPGQIPPTPTIDDDGIEGMPWGNKKIAVVSNPASGKFLGKVGLWQVRKMFLKATDARHILGPLKLADLPDLHAKQAAGRAMRTFVRHGHKKADWDLSAFLPVQGDEIGYDIKKVKGPQWIIHRTVIRKGKAEEKPQRFSENMVRVVFVPEEYHYKNKQKIVDFHAKLDVEEYNPTHVVLGPEGLAKVKEIIDQQFDFYQNHYTSSDVRAWLQNRINEIQGTSLKPGVTFFLEEFGEKATAIKTALKRFREESNAGGRYTTGMQLLPVIDTEEEKDYIASQAASQAAVMLRSAVNDTISMIAKVDQDVENFKKKHEETVAKRKVENPNYVETDADKQAVIKYQEKASQRRVKFMDQFDGLLDASEEYRMKFANVLERRVAYSDAIAEAKQTEQAAETADNPRFAGIAAALKKKGIMESVEAILGYVPEEDEMMIEDMAEGDNGNGEGQ